MFRILVVEDDEVIFRQLCLLLAGEGFEVVDGLRSGGVALDFDLAVLDIGLPGASGYELCAEIKSGGGKPVIFLTSMDTPESELRGFAVGGDDYIRKPFNRAVLIARINRLLKNTRSGVIVIGDMRLDTVKLEVSCGECTASLTKTEFAILRTLAENRGIISRREIIEKLWDSDAYIDENALFVGITRLREKLRGVGLDNAIKTVRGVGYALEL